MFVSICHVTEVLLKLEFTKDKEGSFLQCFVHATFVKDHMLIVDRRITLMNK